MCPLPPFMDPPREWLANETTLFDQCLAAHAGPMRDADDRAHAAALSVMRHDLPPIT